MAFDMLMETKGCRVLFVTDLSQNCDETITKDKKDQRLLINNLLIIKIKHSRHVYCIYYDQDCLII